MSAAGPSAAAVARPRTAAEIARRLGLGASPAWALASAGALAAAGAWREAALVALPEELLFRGLVQGEVETRSGRPFVAVAVAAAAFALAHAAAGGGAGSLLTFFPGLVFGGLRLRARSVWPAVAAHAASNALRVALG